MALGDDMKLLCTNCHIRNNDEVTISAAEGQLNEEQQATTRSPIGAGPVILGRDRGLQHHIHNVA
jgi:hypothetical protein